MIAPYTQPEPWEPDDPRAAAEQITEAELLGLMRKHCQKSWLATRWLLEMQYPEKYGKRKASASRGATRDEFLSAVLGVLTDEIADETLRARIEERLDALSPSKSAHAAAPVTEFNINNQLEPAAALKSKELQPNEPAAPLKVVRPTNVDNKKGPTAEELNSRNAAPPPPAPVGNAGRAAAQAELGRHPEAANKPPLPPPVSWMATARQQYEEKKRLRKQRKQERKKQR